MKKKPHAEQPGGAFSSTALLALPTILSHIKARQTAYASLFEKTPWDEGMLSDIGWLGLIGVPWLVEQVESNGEQHRKDGYANGNPGSDSIGPAQPAIQLVLTEYPHANATLIVPAGNKLAHLLCRFLPKLIGVGVFHGVLRAKVLLRNSVSRICEVALAELHARGTLAGP